MIWKMFLGLLQTALLLYYSECEQYNHFENKPTEIFNDFRKMNVNALIVKDFAQTILNR